MINMKNMTKILLVIGIITILGILVFLPVMIYGGFTVQTVEGTLTFDSTATLSLSKSLKSQTIKPSITAWNIELQNSSQNAYAYAFSGIGGRNDVANDEPNVDMSLELSISFIIKKDGEIVKEINIGLVHGEGQHEVSVVLGPDEGLTSSGTYELYINISLKLTTPGSDLSLDIELGPVSIFVEIS